MRWDNQQEQADDGGVASLPAQLQLVLFQQEECNAEWERLKPIGQQEFQVAP